MEFVCFCSYASSLPSPPYVFSAIQLPPKQDLPKIRMPRESCPVYQRLYLSSVVHVKDLKKIR